MKNPLRVNFSIDPTKPVKKKLEILVKDHLIPGSKEKEFLLDKNQSKNFGPGETFKITNANKFIVTLKMDLKIQF